MGIFTISAGAGFLSINRNWIQDQWNHHLAYLERFFSNLRQWQLGYVERISGNLIPLAAFHVRPPKLRLTTEKQKKTIISRCICISYSKIRCFSSGRHGNSWNGHPIFSKPLSPAHPVRKWSLTPVMLAADLKSLGRDSSPMASGIAKPIPLKMNLKMAP